MNRNVRNWIVFIVLFVVALVTSLYALKGSIVPKKIPQVENYKPWDPELVEYVAQMPVQDGGRLKPFSTWASFALYGIHSKRTITFESDGEKIVLSPTEWMLDTIFRPEVARHLPVFSVNDEKVITELKIDIDNLVDQDGEKVIKKKRDFYTFEQIKSNQFIDSTEAVYKAGEEFREQGMVVKGLEAQKENLISNFLIYGAQITSHDLVETFASSLSGQAFKNKTKLQVEGDSVDEKIRNFVENAFARYEYECAMEKIQMLRYEDFREQDPSIERPRTPLTDSYSRISVYDMHLMPSEDPIKSKWICYKTLLKDYFTSMTKERALIVLGRDLQGATKEELLATQSADYKEAKDELVRWVKLFYVYKTSGDQELLKEFKKMRAEVVQRLEPRQKFFEEEFALYDKRATKFKSEKKIEAAEDEFKKAEFAARKAKRESLDYVESEVIYYKRKYYAMALGFFSLGVCFVLAILPFPHVKFSKLLARLTMVCAIIGAGFIIAGIVHRSLIMGRYPLGNLYDTVLMITSAAVILLVIMEFLSKKVFCVGAAVTLGLLGMILRYRFEIGAGVDNMKPLVAVLNSNYWLAVHVMTITIGYAGGLVAAKLSLFYLFARMTGIDNGDKKLRRSLTRMAYGAACFTLFFSLVGTILGGIWANDSWGRFWGWDPKENGALMIVIWFLAILHARAAGYIKEWGLHIFMLLGANVIAFSWFGVNFLSTGLHSYGFASGGDGEFWLNIYYLLNAGVALVAVGFAWYDIEIKKIRKRERLEQNTDGSPSPLKPKEV